ncbi:hypothetical protein BO83DRAFT_409267 [Aspergillus eucalypticola CBS 122712]|uniref:Uncharacterized protein n=1 Tax=Aspergillus eucalypticola (strain CBS 122712 / IBT 29274) TaxID=1448314 RepID=A0A317VAF5_ASPEC|nr:uncharacterized protein BO83DRAFT_409267 [Aspergillus eucalypticola CBS 122712]PWY70027.1 hypothetical protein BO83DRAFT_409267 [Aspergillus eucalypticola CBS 122712]
MSSQTPLNTGTHTTFYTERRAPYQTEVPLRPETPPPPPPPDSPTTTIPKPRAPYPSWKISHVWFHLPPGAEDFHDNTWPPYRHGLWIEHGPAGRGHLHHVVGNSSDREGLIYAVKHFKHPITNEPTYAGETVIGYLSPERYPDLKQAFLTCQPPLQQKKYNRRTDVTEPFGVNEDGQTVFYSQYRLDNFMFPPLKLDRYFVKLQLLEKVREMKLSRSQAGDYVVLSGFFPAEEWDEPEVLGLGLGSAGKGSG